MYHCSLRDDVGQGLTAPSLPSHISLRSLPQMRHRSPRALYDRRLRLESSGCVPMLAHQASMDMARIRTLHESRILVQSPGAVEPCRRPRHHHSAGTNDNEASHAQTAKGALIGVVCDWPGVCHEDTIRAEKYWG